VNGLFVMLGIETWKPLLTALLLPPVPFLLLLLLGARLLLPSRGLGWLVILFSVAMMRLEVIAPGRRRSWCWAAAWNPMRRNTA
jgi:hypothetical protein